MTRSLAVVIPGGALVLALAASVGPLARPGASRAAGLRGLLAGRGAGGAPARIGFPAESSRTEDGHSGPV